MIILDNQYRTKCILGWGSTIFVSSFAIFVYSYLFNVLAIWQLDISLVVNNDTARFKTVSIYLIVTRGCFVRRISFFLKILGAKTNKQITWNGIEVAQICRQFN
jgi:hypothetical protein